MKKLTLQYCNGGDTISFSGCFESKDVVRKINEADTMMKKKIGEHWILEQVTVEDVA